MKRLKVAFLAASLATCLPVAGHGLQAAKSSLSAAPASSVGPLLGRWDLTIKAAGAEYPSWLELRQEGGDLKARFQGRYDSVEPLPDAVFSHGQLSFHSAKSHQSFEGKMVGASLSGMATGTDGVPMRWIGERAPDLARREPPKWGQPIQLFNGRDLAGWTMDRPGPPVWTVHDGVLVSPGKGPELISQEKFADFKLHIEFNCGENSNSGVYLRGRYELQIENDSLDQPPSNHTGGIYGFLTPSPEQPRTTGEWQSFDITLIGRKVTIVQNGSTVLNNQEIPGITGGALDSDEAAPGPIYLQGSEPGRVSFRNIVLTPGR